MANLHDLYKETQAERDEVRLWLPIARPGAELGDAPLSTRVQVRYYSKEIDEAITREARKRGKKFKADPVRQGEVILKVTQEEFTKLVMCDWYFPLADVPALLPFTLEQANRLCVDGTDDTGKPLRLLPYSADNFLVLCDLNPTVWLQVQTQAQETIRFFAEDDEKKT